MPSATTDLASILTTAIDDGNVAQLSGGTYTVTQPIVIHIDSTIRVRSGSMAAAPRSSRRSPAASR